MGCYFADGTKKGYSWAICASTFEQAKYYISMHRTLIDNPTLNFNVSYSSLTKQSANVLDPYLRDIWKKHAGVTVNEKKLRIRYLSNKDPKKHNKYGTLIIREHKELLVIFYNRLLRYAIEYILKNRSKTGALNFICGVFEGDGCVNAKKRAHIQVATNKNDKDLLEKVLRISNLKFSTGKEGENKYRINIGALELIKNLSFLKNKLFKYYPKRRKRLIERLCSTGAARFLMGKQDSTSGWIKSYLRSINFLNKDYGLTKLGEKIKGDLVDLEKELRPSPL